MLQDLAEEIGRGIYQLYNMYILNISSAILLRTIIRPFSPPTKCSNLTNDSCRFPLVPVGSRWFPLPSPTSASFPWCSIILRIVSRTAALRLVAPNGSQPRSRAGRPHPAEDETLWWSHMIPFFSSCLQMFATFLTVVHYIVFLLDLPDANCG